jgi:hypothetical protein
MGTLQAFDISELMEKYNLTVFFETGTAEGAGIQYIVRFPFKKIYTVEIVKRQVEKLRIKFDTLLYDWNILNIIHGDSLSVMEELLPKINGNILFWLDAHYPMADLIQNDINKKIEAYVGAGLDDKKIRLPLENEIELIKKLRPNKKDVILLDDLHIYSNNISPEAFWLMPQQRFSENFYKDVLKDSHMFKQVNDMQGVLLPND